MANLENLKSTKAVNILKGYEGKNPYIKKFKRELLNNGDISLTNVQYDYIINNHDFEPKIINKIVGITEYLGTELKNQYNLSFTPERILIEYLLADNDKTFHIYGKLKRNQEKSQMYFIPKSQLLDDFLFEEKDIEVDFEKYEKIDKFVLSNGTVGRKFYEQQKDGIKFLLSRKGAILADSMGVGKTVQATVAALESGCERILIVCPSAVKINWQREIGYYDCHDSVIIDGKKWEQAKFTIINFDILKNFHVVPGEGMKEEDICWDNQELVKANFDLIIIDEAHKLKNHKSTRGAIMKDLCTNYGEKRVWLLSGTPVANRPMDYYNLLALINSPIVANWKHYVKRYCDGKQITTTLKNGRQKKVWLTNGASNLEELAIKTKNTYLRRLKSELGDIPEKTIIPIYHKLTNEQWEKHNELWEEYLIERQQKKKRGEPERDLVELGLLRKYIAMQSIPKTIELVEDILESGEKVIIFCNFTEELMELKNHFGKRAVVHYGQMSDKDKQKSIDDFQLHDKADVFIGNIISAGVGITLTKATYVVFNSFSWVPGDNEQGEDRCVFGGQWVLTDNGYVLIEDINIGDMVYTHNGNFKKVINKKTRLEREKLRYDINALGFNKNLSVTNDHKLYIYDNQDNMFKWLEAEKINIRNHSLTFKCNQQPIKRLEYIELQEFINPLFKNKHNVTQKNARLVKLPKQVKLTNDLLYAFGFFIADGWTSISPNKSSTVNVCQKITNKKMYDASEYIINIFKESFGFEKHSSYVDKNNAKTCTIHSKELALNFKKWFGNIVYDKQLPDWADKLNNEQLESLLDGYYHGDGYQRGKKQQATTASLKLISQLVRYNTNLGRTVTLCNKGKNNYTIEYSFNDVLNKKIKIIDGYTIYPIKTINISKPSRGEERVYDLSVEDDHSFVVGNYNVHNCYRLGQKNNVTIYYQLFENTVSVRMWETLKQKQNVIDTIMNEAGLDEDEIIGNIMNKILEEDE